MQKQAAKIQIQTQMLALSPSSLSLFDHPLTLAKPSLPWRLSPSSNPGFSKIRSSSTLKVSEAAATVEVEDKESRSEPAASSTALPAIKATKRVVLVRHGQSTWNAEGRIQGSSNFSVLTPKGESQAVTSRQMLLDDSFDVCFTSPLARSKKTAEIIWDNRKEPMIPEFDLREIDLYSFQGLLKHEGKEKFGPAYHQWQVDAPNFVIDGHYPVRELWARARNCWDRILAYQSKSVLVVAHNAVNQALIATAIGLGTDYFRVLLQSNCGVSVLDFIPRAEGGSPYICLNRLNQTPNSPLAGGSSGGRKTSQRIILVCYGSLQSTGEADISNPGDWPMNMLGIIQSQKTAELLLDLKVDTIVSGQRKASVEAAKIISQFQEAADCLGADCVPRYVDVKEIQELDVEMMLDQSKEASIADTSALPQLSGVGSRVSMDLWNRAGKVWQTLLEELSNPDGQKVVVAVGHPTLHIALLGHCLNLTQDWMGSFHLDEGSISVIDFPDGPSGRGTVRCINYTAHLGRWAIPITKPTDEEEEFY